MAVTLSRPYLSFASGATVVFPDDVEASLIAQGYGIAAFTLAMVPMYTPESGTGVKCTQMSDSGFTVKVTKGSDILNGANIVRIDVLYGWCATYPETDQEEE